jgi:hypothetical protein
MPFRFTRLWLASGTLWLLLALTLWLTSCTRTYTPETLVVPPHPPSDEADTAAPCPATLPRFDVGERATGWIPLWL